MRTAFERELELLEEELEQAESEEEEREILGQLRALEREESERLQWEEEGHERGWY